MTIKERIKAVIQETNIREKASMLGAIVIAIATSYVGLAEIWGLPGAEHVMETATIIAAVIATILGARTCINKLEEPQPLDEKVGEDNAEEK